MTKKAGSAKDARARQWTRRGHFDIVVADPAEALEALADAEARLLVVSTSYTADPEVKKALIAEAESDVAEAAAAVDACKVRLWFQKIPRKEREAIVRRHPRPTQERGEDGAFLPLTAEQAADYHFVEALACAMAHAAGDTSMSEAEWIEWLNSDEWEPEDFSALADVLTEVQMRGSNVAMLGKGLGPTRSTTSA